MEYSITYADGEAIAINQLLAANTREIYKVRIEFKKDVEEEDLPDSNQQLNFVFNVNYVQADSNAVAVSHAGEYLDDYYDNYIYSVNDDIDFYIGEGVPNQVTLYNSYAELKANSDRQVFMRYKLAETMNNGVYPIEEAYIGVVKDGHVYIIQGGIDETGLDTTAIYDQNVNVLNQFFGSENCETEENLVNYTKQYTCEIDDYESYISLRSSGSIDSIFYDRLPVIDSDGRTGLYTN